MRFEAALIVSHCLAAPCLAADPKPTVLASGLKNPSAVTIGPDGRTYVAVKGEVDTPGDGAVLLSDGNKFVPFARGLDDPIAMAAWRGSLYVADGRRVWRIDAKGQPAEFVGAKSFPESPHFLHDIAVDERGVLYVTETGDPPRDGAIFRILPNKKVERVAARGLIAPRGIVMDGMSHVLVTDAKGALHRLRLSDGTLTKVADGGFVSLAWDWRGRLFLGTRQGSISVRPRPGVSPIPMPGAVSEMAGICATADGMSISVVDAKAGTVVSVPAVVPGEPLDESPLPIATEIAFPNLEWTDWLRTNKAGNPIPLRPILLTHAGDGSGRVFVPTQHGVIHVFPNDDAAKRTKVFLDLQPKVRYDDQTNEEGFLGLAFHPRYKTNGEFFVFYTDRKAKLTNVVSRFRVSKDDPDRADPNSEEELMRIEHRFWNHDGGTICFGPDGFLYVAVGDGGAANDPDNNGQNLGTILGKVLRIDVNRKGRDKPYAIPDDNPFAARGGARPEVFAYGLRNVWRMAFDRPTGRLWAADVGQNLYEEIVLLERGKNYGWNLREGFHPFGPRGTGRRPELVEPIWEYHHDIGKSITGGAVYRGQRLPELAGAYVYGDYVSMRIWALWYDDKLKRVVANRPIRDPQKPILSFGEDDRGELYFTTDSATGRGLYRFVRP